MMQNIVHSYQEVYRNMPSCHEMLKNYLVKNKKKWQLWPASSSFAPSCCHKGSVAWLETIFLIKTAAAAKMAAWQETHHAVTMKVFNLLTCLDSW